MTKQRPTLLSTLAAKKGCVCSFQRDTFGLGDGQYLWRGTVVSVDRHLKQTMVGPALALQFRVSFLHREWQHQDIWETEWCHKGFSSER
mmetsp:Transcript_14211/g.20856  ORF Transcript_14211/g.20856 Transcript_14211/m.20856 type:complete len:89 (-) Transcript_14211:196-462(-)